MEEKQKVEKNNFFKKAWYSITKFEQYPTMAMEGLKRAIKYLAILMAIVSIFIMINSLLELKELMVDVANYIQNNIPEFSYFEGELNLQSEDTIVLEEFQDAGIDKVVINTIVEKDEQKSQIENENLADGITLFLFKDRLVLKAKIEEKEIVRQDYTYSDFIAGYTGENIESFDKVRLVQYLTSEKMTTFYIRYGAAIFIYLLITNIIVGLLDALEIALLGWITASIARIRMKFVAIYNMAIYSLTLPIVLNILYISINHFTGFTIEYFQVAYITIAYIYLAASIFILKDDFIKKMQEVEKIKQEQLKVREEIKEEEEEQEEQEEQEEKGSLEDGQG